MEFPSVSSLKTAAAFRSRIAELGIDLPLDETIEVGPNAPFAQPQRYKNGVIGNRLCVLPMEGWDGSADGRPTELTTRRWQNFGRSGAKLIWGGEAVAVRHDGRANPNQLVLNQSTLTDIAALRDELVSTHRKAHGSTDDLLVGLQLTHSGRFAKPNDQHRPEPRILYRHPYLDAKVGIKDDQPIMSDDELARLVDDYVRAGCLARDAGFAFVDIKHCHGYLSHELLSAYDRPGRYGGSFDNRTRFLRDVVQGLRASAPGLEIGVRLSVFDFMPFQMGPDGTGTPIAAQPYRFAFGGDGTGLGMDLTEPLKFLELLTGLNIELVCTTAGNPYAAPHIPRPAAFPPSDGYWPPEDPLVGVARQIGAVAKLKLAFPNLIFVGSGYSYLQDWLPNVGQRVLRDGMADFIGLGRMMLAYPELPSDVLAGRPLDRKRICRTFSDCTTAPRNGMVSGCYPLDPHYKNRAEAVTVGRLRKRSRI